MSRLIVLSHGFHTEIVFNHMFDSVLLHKKYTPLELKKGDCVMFEGGTDINPLIYDEEPNSYTSQSDYSRDAFEMEVFRQAVSKSIPMIGICRGAQLLCALSGGKLVQHVNKHTQDHWVEDYKGRSYKVTSSHHQMMLPGETKHKMIASTKRATLYLDENDESIPVNEDAEIVWFEKTKCLSIQGHPEWALGTMFHTFCSEYVKDFIQGG